jgi:predicted RNase H-like HicB family nuclease
MELNAVFIEFPEGYAAFVEELPGANTQGATLEEARANLAEVAKLILESNRQISEESITGENVIREPFALPA